jgi:hypothetical protein
MGILCPVILPATCVVSLRNTKLAQPRCAKPVCYCDSAGGGGRRRGGIAFTAPATLRMALAQLPKETSVSDSMYKVIELIGSSTES